MMQWINGAQPQDMGAVVLERVARLRESHGCVSRVSARLREQTSRARVAARVVEGDAPADYGQARAPFRVERGEVCALARFD